MRWFPLLLLVGFGVLVLGLPLARLYRRYGAWGIARPKEPVHRAMVSALFAAVGLAVVWAVAVAWAGPEAVGVWILPAPVAWSGVALGAFGIGLVVTAQLHMGASWRIGISEERTGLVTSGLFAFVRHPIYTGLFALLGALVLLTPSAWTVMAALWIGSLIALQARLEEAHLAAAHGGAFSAWAARTGRFLPGVGRLTAVEHA